MLTLLSGSFAVSTALAQAGAVSARGRLEPKDGVRRVAGPSDFVAVVARLDVDRGDRVTAGQVLAVMDTLAAREARVARAQAEIASQEAVVARCQAELANAGAEHERRVTLSRDGVVSVSELEVLATRLAVARAALAEAEARRGALRAELASAQAERELSIVRAPIAGQVLEVHTRPGEKVSADGILELGRTDAMYAIAEVYETDVARLKAGQKATVRSPALGRDLTGTVERIGMKVGTLRSLGTDLAARTDARIVEVEVRLDDSAAAAAFTDLEVEVVIQR